MICGVGCRHSSDPVLLWVWRRPAATALIRPLAWEPPCAKGAAQEMANKKKKKKQMDFGPWNVLPIACGHRISFARVGKFISVFLICLHMYYVVFFFFFPFIYLFIYFVFF